MSKFQSISDSEYKSALKKCWELELNLRDCMLEKIADWVEYNAILLGVPDTYLLIPLIVATYYLTQHAIVTVADIHTEPVILYGLVAGRSGTNKSASLKMITDLINSIANKNGSQHTFDSGTHEGLLKSLKDNNESILAVYDEFNTFTDSLDRGSSSNFERSRFLTLYSGSSWSKTTKNSGSYNLENPRFNMLSFTQPYYATQFAKNNVVDGFFQRFLLAVPKEVFIKMNDKFEVKERFENKSLIDMLSVLNSIYDRGSSKELKFDLSPNAIKLYINYTDSCVDFRKQDLFEDSKVSIKSKSNGLVLRISAVINCLRNALKKINDENYKEDNIITEKDYEMALIITEYSVNVSFALLPEIIHKKIDKASSSYKPPVPEPANFTMEYAMVNQKIIKKYLSTSSIPMNIVTRDKLYPIVQNVSGKDVAHRFVNGLETLGFGVLSPNSKKFKRFNIDDENCPDRENLRKKYKMLNLINEEN